MLHASSNRFWHKEALNMMHVAIDDFQIPHCNFTGTGSALFGLLKPPSGNEITGTAYQAVFNSPQFGLIRASRAARFLQIVARIEI